MKNAKQNHAAQITLLEKKHAEQMAAQRRESDRDLMAGVDAAEAEKRGIPREYMIENI